MVLILFTDRVALVSSGIPGCSACRQASSPGYTSDGKSKLKKKMSHKCC